MCFARRLIRRPGAPCDGKTGKRVNIHSIIFGGNGQLFGGGPQPLVLHRRRLSQ